MLEEGGFVRRVVRELALRRPGLSIAEKFCEIAYQVLDAHVYLAVANGGRPTRFVATGDPRIQVGLHASASDARHAISAAPDARRPAGAHSRYPRAPRREERARCARAG